MVHIPLVDIFGKIPCLCNSQNIYQWILKLICIMTLACVPLYELVQQAILCKITLTFNCFLLALRKFLSHASKSFNLITYSLLGNQDLMKYMDWKEKVTFFISKMDWILKLAWSFWSQMCRFYNLDNKIIQTKVFKMKTIS